MEIVRRFFNDPETSFFLFGARGTGKSTWLKMNFTKDTLYVDLLSPENFRKYSARPERLEELLAGNPDAKTVIVDEIQKVPELLDVVHHLIEEKKDVRFILTGSSSRKLKRSGVDLLAGRAIHKTFHPFMGAELAKSFNLAHALNYGLIPLVYVSKNPIETLHSYITLYVNEEVKMEGLVRKVGDFSRFLETVSFSNGSVINISEIARDSQVGRKAVEGYISILEDLLLAVQIPVFTKKAKRLLIAHPKFYFFDTGVFRALRPTGPLDRPQEIDGLALETLTLQHLRAWIAYSGNGNKIYYWRTKAGVEVDFIVYGADHFYAIEVKNTDTVRSNDLKGLKAFLSDYPQAKGYLIYRGKEKIMINNILCLPAGDFYQNLIPGKAIG
jgi:predicted AAA+ superfamily ATPase